MVSRRCHLTSLALKRRCRLTRHRPDPTYRGLAAYSALSSRLKLLLAGVARLTASTALPDVHSRKDLRCKTQRLALPPQPSTRLSPSRFRRQLQPAQNIQHHGRKIRVLMHNFSGAADLLTDVRGAMRKRDRLLGSFELVRFVLAATPVNFLS